MPNASKLPAAVLAAAFVVAGVFAGYLLVVRNRGAEKNQALRTGRNYVEFRLTGTISNRDAIGALVRLWVGQTVMVRQVNPAGGYLAQ
ncbi:MAG: hypothetical protein NVSMB53_10670 [Gemmatimonadaceae bacterium]